jgi:GNAT superfamily N-acetyltransferase
VGLVRWRPVDNLDAPTAAGSVAVALIDRVFVMPSYRRRRVGRVLMLQTLYDIASQSQARGLSISRISVLLPEEQRLIPVLQLLIGLGFKNAAKRSDDPSGMWSAAGAAGAAPAAPRSFVEMFLNLGDVMPLLQQAQANKESVRPAMPA